MIVVGVRMGMLMAMNMRMSMIVGVVMRMPVFMRMTVNHAVFMAMLVGVQRVSRMIMVLMIVQNRGRHIFSGLTVNPGWPGLTTSTIFAHSLRYFQ